MTSRSHLGALSRLAAVYKIVAHLDAMALERANAAVREVELLLEQQRSLAQAVNRRSHEALVREDRMEWLLSESQLELALWNQAGLESVRGQRSKLQEHALDLQRSSALQHNQVDAIAEQARKALRYEIERRQQAEADDRYLARAQWLAHRTGRRVNSS
jgi:hypothetical protein